ncbi:hypothetical protein RFF05_14795 [Bengtsoniella intestinalis]|uniref:hypothetical protein n=1 Tax=Bengtsoniella intestinalis TaxID=3073143 RepID=UPI00391EFEB2
MFKMKKLLSFVLALSLLCIPLLGNTAYAASNEDIATLIIYSSHDNSHSWLVVENLSTEEITVGKYTVAGEDSVTIGTFGNKDPHSGIWYNIEGAAAAAANVSTSMNLTETELSTVTSTINSNNSYSVTNNNCSTFASKVWNSVSNTDVSPGGFIDTPSALADSIEANFPNSHMDNRAIPSKGTDEIAYHKSSGIVYHNPFGDDGGGSSSSRSYVVGGNGLTDFTEAERAILDQYHK